MLVSEEKKLIFVHPTATGGSYFWKLYPKYWATHPEGTLSFLHSHPRHTTAHTSMREIEVLFRGDLTQYRKVATVRDPWDRYHSWYNILLRAPRHEDYGAAVSAGSFEQFMVFVAKGLLGCMSDPQWNFLASGKGAIDYDFVIRFESLEADCEEVGDLCGMIERETVQRTSGSIEHKAAYTPLARRIVEEICAPEIEFLGYEF